MKKILIYGVKCQAEQLRFYIENERKGNVFAFVVDKDYLENLPYREKDGLPVVTFETALIKYPPNEYEMCVSLAYQHLVHDREDKIEKSRRAGYHLYSFISDKAICYAKMGEGNIVYPGCVIAYGVTVGDGNFFEIGVRVCHHVRIGNYNFFAPASVILGNSEIKNNNFFGANSVTIGNGMVEEDVIIGANAVIKEGQKKKVYLPQRTSLWHGESDTFYIE